MADTGTSSIFGPSKDIDSINKAIGATNFDRATETNTIDCSKIKNLPGILVVNVNKLITVLNPKLC